MGISRKPIPVVFAPETDRIAIVCPVCEKGGVWVFPEGFHVRIVDYLFVTCSNGHQFEIHPESEEERDRRARHDN
jgi:hypothetical protein